MATTTINTHLGKNIEWIVYRNGHNQIELDLTLNGGAYDISNLVFTVHLRTPNGDNDKLTLEEGDDLTNGGADGTLTIPLTEADLATLPRDRYFILIDYDISGLTYPLVQGFVRIQDETNPGTTTTTVTIPVTISSTTVSMAVTVVGGTSAADVLDMVNNAVANAEISAGLEVSLAAYGAVGDGTTDDRTAIASAITAAGVGGILKGTPGKTYLLKSGISILGDQTLDLNGATLKRCDAIYTTLTANANANVLSITVASTTDFSVGDSFIITDSGSPLGGVGYLETSMPSDTIPHVITQISGNVITFTGAVTLTSNLSATGYFPIGEKVIKVFSMVASASGTTGSTKGFKIIGGTIDGNRANNNLTYSWVVNRTITSMQWGSVIQYCVFKEIPNENILPSRNCFIQNNIFYNCNGSICHISSSSNTPLGYGNNVITNNLAFDIAEQAAANGHCEAAVVVSANVEKTYITGNVIERCGAAIFATSGVSSTNQVAECYLYNNMVKTSVGIVYSRASNEVNNLIYISGNKFMDSQWLICDFNTTGTITVRQGSGHKNIHFTNNICRNTVIHFVGVTDFNVAGNKFEYDSNYTFTAPTGFSGTPSKALNFTNCSNAIISNNNIENRGTSTLTGAICLESGQSRTSKVLIKSDASTNTVYAYFGRNFKVGRNLIAGFAYGIEDWKHDSISGFNIYNRERDFAFLGTDFTDNTIFLNEDASNVGIICGPGVTVRGNQVYGNANNSERGIMAFGVNDGLGSGYTGPSSPTTKIPGPVVTGNTVIGCTESIKVGYDPGGTTLGDNTYNATVKYNYVSVAVTDSSASHSTVSDNITIVASVPPLQLIRENPDFY